MFNEVLKSEWKIAKKMYEIVQYIPEFIVLHILLIINSLKLKSKKMTIACGVASTWAIITISEIGKRQRISECLNVKNKTNEI